MSEPEVVIHLPLEGRPWLELRAKSDDQLERVLDWIAQPATRKHLRLVAALATGETHPQ